MREATFLERLAENLLEAGFARAFKTKLQPVQIAKALSREMERTRVVGPGAPLVANRYRVHLHPDDLASFAGFQASLEQEFCAYLSDYAERRGLKPLAAPTVHLLLAPDGGKPGTFTVEGELVDPEPAPAPLGPPVPAFIGERTVEMPAVSSTPVSVAAATAPALNRPAARLEDPSGRELALTGPVTRLGRAVDNDIVLEDRGVSRHHARIVWEAGRYVLVDLGSTNGSFVAGQRVTRRQLAGGEEISLGGTARFTFRTADD